MAKGEKIKKGLKNIGWLVAFPVPVTKALAKKQGGKFGKKAATIAATWALYLGIATAGVSASANRWIQSAREKQAAEAAGTDINSGTEEDPQAEEIWDLYDLTLEPGEQYQIIPRTLGDTKHVQYHVYGPDCITVNQDGLITADRYGKSEVFIYGDDGNGETCFVTVAKHRETKLSTKVVAERGEFSEEDWDVSLEINWEPVEDGQIYDLWEYDYMYFSATITSKRTGDSRKKIIAAYPEDKGVINGFQMMLPVTVTEQNEDGTETVTSFRVYFHFDGNLFTAENEAIFGKMGSMKLDITNAYGFDFMFPGEVVKTDVQTDGNKQNLVYLSGDESVIKIDDNGRAVSIGPGETYILVYDAETYDWSYAPVYVTGRLD